MQFNKLVISVAVAAIAAAGIATTAAARDNGKIESGKLIGVPATMARELGNIRGINGGGLPWTIGDSDVVVRESGKIEVEFDNLVFAAGDNIGKNTVPSMAIVVSCLDAANLPVNVVSEPFPVTVTNGKSKGGDASVSTRVDLPTPCFAPIVFVTNSTGVAWLAVDGL